MKVSHGLRRVALAAALAVAGAVQAGPAWVQVEVIAFQYTQTGSETWAESSDLPVLDRATLLARPEADAEVPPPQTAAAPPVAYRALAPHELKLAGAWKVLARAGHLRPLLHLGWHQPDTDSRDVRLRLPEEANGQAEPEAEAIIAPALDGVLRVAPATEDAWRLTARCVTRAGETPVVFSETRRLTLDELHYLDHPLLGLLVQVTAVPLPEAPGEAADAAATADEGISPGALPD